MSQTQEKCKKILILDPILAHLRAIYAPKFFGKFYIY